MAKILQTQENKQEHESEVSKPDFAPYWSIYPTAQTLYAVMMQGSYVVFDTHLKAEKYQAELLKFRNTSSEIKEIER